MPKPSPGITFDIIRFVAERIGNALLTKNECFPNSTEMKRGLSCQDQEDDHADDGGNASWSIGSWC